MKQQRRPFSILCFSWFLLLAVPLPAQEQEVDESGPEAGRQLEEGIRLYRQEQYSEAETVLRRFLAENPENVRGQAYLGLVLLELERWDEAEAQLTRARQTAPMESTLAEIGIGLARVALKRGDTDRAIDHLNQAARLAPEDPDVYHYRGIARTSRGDYPAALQDLEKAIELDPSHAYSHYYLGTIYSRLRRPDRMVDHFQMFLKLAPDAPEAARVRTLLRTVR